MDVWKRVAIRDTLGKRDEWKRGGKGGVGYGECMDGVCILIRKRMCI